MYIKIRGVQKTNKPKKNGQNQHNRVQFFNSVLVRFSFRLNFLKSKYFSFGFGAGFFHPKIYQINRYIEVYVSLKHNSVSSLVE